MANDCTLWARLESSTSDVGPNGTTVGSPSFPVGGKFGNALDIDADGKHIAWSASTLFPIQDEWCLEFWFKPYFNIVNGAPPGGIFYTASIGAWYNTATAKPLYAYWNSGSAHQFSFRNSGDTGWLIAILVDNYSLAAGVWGHFAIVRSAAAAFDEDKTAAIYFNGVQLKSSNTAGTTNTMVGKNLYLGSNLGVAGRNANGMYDNVRVWNYPRTDFSGRDVEWGPHTQLTDSYRGENPKIYVMGMDVFERIEKMPVIEYYKTLGRDKVLTNSLQLTAGNYDGMFSLEHPSSIFAGTRWRYTPLTIHDRFGTKIWTGEVSGLKQDYQSSKTTIESKNTIFKFRNDRVVYTSAAPETPADAFYNVCLQVGFTAYNEQARATSATQQAAAGLLVSLDIREDKNATFQQVIEKLGDYGAADVYDFDNEIYYVHWGYFTGGVGRYIGKEQIVGKVTGEWIDRAMYNEYAIAYSGMPVNTPSTDYNSNSIATLSRQIHGTHTYKDVPGELEDEYRISTKAGATYLGECMIRRSHRALSTQPESLIKITLDLNIENRFWVDLRTFFRLTWEQEGWAAKTFEIYKIRRDEEKESISIEAYEVASA